MHELHKGASIFDPVVKRRSLLAWSGVSAALAFTVGFPDRAHAEVSAANIRSDPFRLGVASGDPLPDAVVLWTRLAPEPLEPYGGMELTAHEVQWQVSKDPHFRAIVRAGVATAHPEVYHSVHVDVRGLQPGTEYFYRFRAGRYLSDVGRTKTAPAPHETSHEVHFAFASCQYYTEGYYTALAHLAEEAPDVVFFLGDYIYEYGVDAVGGRRALTTPLPVALNEDTVTLDRYRLQYSLYKSDPDLIAAHQAAPWICTWDDHDVENDYAGPNPGTGGYPASEFLVRRANAYRAYWENLPLRLPSPTGPDMRLYRGFDYGRVARFSVLDTRQYRSAEIPGKSPQPDSPARRDPDRQMLGAAQEKWLVDDLSTSEARWKIVPQGVVMSQLVSYKDGVPQYGKDPWDGYFAARQRVTAAVHDHGIENFVVLTGDAHTNYAFNMRTDFNDPESPACGVELVGTSITSMGDGHDTTPALEQRKKDNPDLVFANQQRGYVSCRATDKDLKIDYKVVPRIVPRGAPIHTRQSFVVEPGKPVLNAV